MNLESVLYALDHHQEIVIPIMLFTFFGSWVVVHHVAKVFTTGARERTKREIAAYIAEGSMTPEQGERILKAKVRQD